MGHLFSGNWGNALLMKKTEVKRNYLKTILGRSWLINLHKQIFILLSFFQFCVSLKAILLAFKKS